MKEIMAQLVTLTGLCYVMKSSVVLLALILATAIHH
jgi:hypothetical protein